MKFSGLCGFFDLVVGQGHLWNQWADCGLVEKLDEQRGAGTLGFCVAKFCCMIFVFSRGVSVWWVFWVVFRVWGLYWAVKGFEDFPGKRLGLRVVSDGLEIAGLDC